MSKSFSQPRKDFENGQIRALRPIFLACLLLGLLFSSFVLADTGTDSPKKGIALSLKLDPDGTRLGRLNVHWYYNWKLKPNSPHSSDCFVPMYWGKKGDIENVPLQISAPVPVLLVLNEPDHRYQANRTVPEALEEWPTLAKLADEISAPSPANALGHWMRDYMKRAEDLGYSADFVPVHWFGPPDSRLFLNYLERVHKLYDKPLWITEFAVSDRQAAKQRGPSRYTEDQVIDFLETVLPELEKRDYVERYAWASVQPHKPWLSPSLLFTRDGTITRLGQIYASYMSSETKDSRCSNSVETTDHQ